MADNVHGTCGVCGGPVCTPEIWSGINPPEKRCKQCGRVAARSHGPVVEMQPDSGLARQLLRNDALGG